MQMILVSKKAPLQTSQYINHANTICGRWNIISIA